MSDNKPYDRRVKRPCDECGKVAPLNNIYASHSADVQKRLCDECRDKRIAELERMYQGD